MTQNAVGIFLSENLVRVTRRVVGAQEVLNALSRTQMPSAKVTELSGKARADLSAALESLELILEQLNKDEFRPL
jgi:hypothetical protein